MRRDAHHLQLFNTITKLANLIHAVQSAATFSPISLWWNSRFVCPGIWIVASKLPILGYVTVTIYYLESFCMVWHSMVNVNLAYIAQLSQSLQCAVGRLLQKILPVRFFSNTVIASIFMVHVVLISD